MNKGLQASALAMLIMFTATEFVYAASISTRVRIVEGKAAQNAKTIKYLQSTQAQQISELSQKLHGIKDLESKIDFLMQEREKKVKHPEDKRYSYP